MFEPDEPRPLVGRRISVVGATGSGKTYLSGNLARQLCLPLYSLDDCRSGVERGENPNDEFERRVSRLVMTDQWIIDGHYRVVRDAIWKRAETIVWLDYPVTTIALRLLTRFVHKQLKSGGRMASIPSSDAETVSSARADWKSRINRWRRTLRERREYGRLLNGKNYSAVVVRLRSSQDTQNWLASLGTAPSERGG